MTLPAGPVTFLFTDIEGSSRLWEHEPERMRRSLARHDAVVRESIARHAGRVVKMLGDGVHAAFTDPVSAIEATVDLQTSLAASEAEGEVPLRVRCGLHAGVVEARDGDFFGSPVNRAARIMGAAHGGQTLLSAAVADLVGQRLPPGIALKDLGAVRLKDLARPERVFQLVHPKLRAQFPALRSLESTPNNLPQQVTSLIGRERELSEVKALLDTARLVTLLGTGGIGKTRLALHAAAELLDENPDGVQFVDLAPLSDAHLVPETVASVLGIKEDPGQAVIAALARYVSDRRMLLVLDNCEHLLRACADIATHLLKAGAQLRILAASREPLRVTGETVYAVPALDVPGEDASVTPQVLESCEATRLFITRARASNARFGVTDRNAAAIVDICRRLDGIPLAIELAAARVRTLTPEAICARLSDRFRLLARGDATALPRQQTLRALIDWSHELLSQPERVLLRRLAVFAGGWSLETLEAVAAGGDIDEREIVELNSLLVDKSIVAMDANGSRYRLLDTVREYAREHLDASADGPGVRGKHLAHFVAMAEQARGALNGSEQAERLAQLDLERENFLVAHANAAEGGAELGLRLVYALAPYWFLRGRSELALQLSAEALERPDARQRTAARARALFAAGQQRCFTGRYNEAQSVLEESLLIGRQLGDRDHIARVLQPLGMAALGRGDMASARAYLRDAVELAREMGDKRELAAALNGLAQLHRADGELDAAEPLFEQVVALAREADDPESMAIGLLNLAMVAIGRGRRDSARPMLADVLATAQRTGSRPVGMSALDVAAGYAVSISEYERAARFFGAAHALISATGLRRDPTDETFIAPLLERAREMLGAGGFESAERAGGSLGYDKSIEEARDWLAKIG